MKKVLTIIATLLAISTISKAQDTTKTKYEIFFPDTVYVVSNAEHDQGKYIWFGVGLAKLKLKKGQKIKFQVFSMGRPWTRSEHSLTATENRREYLYYENGELRGRD